MTIARHFFVDLYRHMEWADAAAWTAVMASEKGRADARLRDLFHHLHLVQRAFLRTWRGEPRETPYPTFTDAAALLAWGRTYYAEAFAHLESMDAAGLAAPMSVPWAAMVERAIGRAPGATTVGETVLQVALHSQYHRGQIGARLREVGGTPPLVDFIAWVWFGRPAPAWPPT